MKATLTLAERGRLLELAQAANLGRDRPPIVVPPTVLVQGPPEAWGEGR